MKEPYDQDVASQVGPESCGCVREGAVEALTGVRTGWVLSPVNSTSGMPRRFPTSEGNTRSLDKRERPGPAGSEAPCTYGSTTRGSREILRPTAADATVRAVNLQEYDGDARAREVGQVRSTEEAVEQGCGCGRTRGGGGGKAPGQGEIRCRPQGHWTQSQVRSNPRPCPWIGNEHGRREKPCRHV